MVVNTDSIKVFGLCFLECVMSLLDVPLHYNAINLLKFQDKNGICQSSVNEMPSRYDETPLLVLQSDLDV